MKQRTLTFKNFDDVELQSRDFALPPGHRRIDTTYSTVSPGTELFCVRESMKEGKSVQPGYILAGKDAEGRRVFLFPSLSESSGCHCDVRAAGPESLLIPLPPEVPDLDAGFLRFINIGLHALNQPAKTPSSVCVIGLGPVGNMACQTAKLLGCEVVGVDTSAKRREIANACGVEQAVAPDKLSGQFDLVVDTVAGSSSLRAAAATLKEGGECAMVGIVRDGDLPAAELLREVWKKRLIFRSGWEMLQPLSSTADNLGRALNWMKAGSYRLAPLLTGVIPAEAGAIKDAYRRLRDQPDDNFCYMIRWQ